VKLPGQPVVELRDVSLLIPVEGATKRSLKANLVTGLTGGLLRREPRRSIGVEALSNLNLVIRSGERIALLGHNGAGKSTLLRLLCDIYSPSSGRINRSVSIEPMIDKSSWVDQDLTGYHAAKVQYLLNRNSLKGFDEFYGELLAFTELADFMHIPLRTYSDGMRTRLQFGLLTGFRHDALALDEGIGAGDQSFLNKAQDRLSSFLGNVGTLILASHSNDLLRQFCKRGVVLSHGRIVFDGGFEAAEAYYLSHLSE